MSIESNIRSNTNFIETKKKLEKQQENEDYTTIDPESEYFSSPGRLNFYIYESDIYY